MDLNTLRSLVTVISLAVFVGIVAWAWSRKRRAAFDEAALLPFADDAPAPAEPPAARPRPGSGPGA